MSDTHPSSVSTRTGGSEKPGVWLQAPAVDALIKECARILFEQCRVDYRRWLSEGDLKSIYYAILRRELPARGVPSCAVHAGYPYKLSTEWHQKLGNRRRQVRVDLALIVPESIRIVRGRHWEGQIAAAIEVKRGFERYNETKGDLAKLAAIRGSRPDVQVYMLIMGYKNGPEQIAALERSAARMQIPLLCANYWGTSGRIDQPTLI